MNIQIDTKTISYGKGGKNSLEVRGLSTYDLTFLAKDNMDQLNELYDLAEKGLGEAVDLNVFGLELLEKFPQLVAQMIALAADAPNQAGECLRLPAPVQLQAINSIYEMTIEDTGGLEDFLGLMVATISKMKKATL